MTEIYQDHFSAGFSLRITTADFRANGVDLNLLPAVSFITFVRILPVVRLVFYCRFIEMHTRTVAVAVASFAMYSHKFRMCFPSQHRKQ